MINRNQEKKVPFPPERPLLPPEEQPHIIPGPPVIPPDIVPAPEIPTTFPTVPDLPDIGI